MKGLRKMGNVGFRLSIQDLFCGNLKILIPCLDFNFLFSKTNHCIANGVKKRSYIWKH